MTPIPSRRHGAVLLIAAGLVAAGLVAPAAAQSPSSHAGGHANGHSKGHCRAFHAHGVGEDNGDGTTTATLYRGRRVVAGSQGAFVITGTDAEGRAVFTGAITLTDDHGTLVAPVTGTLDPVSGEFVSDSDTVAGTGDYAAVTGRLRFAGVEDLSALTFTETVHGKLCVPKKKQH